MSLRYSSRSEAKAARRASKKRRRERQQNRPELFVQQHHPRSKAAGCAAPTPIPGESIYDFRGRILFWLEFNCYGEYLGSELYKEIRRRVWDRDNSRCVICRGLARDTHHETYSVENMTGENIDTIVCLCRPCHRFIEVKPNGDKIIPRVPKAEAV